jgi:hypothetical protein
MIYQLAEVNIARMLAPRMPFRSKNRSPRRKQKAFSQLRL